MNSNENLLSEIPRLSWEEAFMSMVCIYAMRSPDLATRHGCVIVDVDNHPVGWGYNGFPKGGTNELYPTDRPRKYNFCAHAELNSLLNRTMNTSGGTAYVTGKPCCGCMVAMIQAGIKKVVYGKIGSHCVDSSGWKDVIFMSEDCGVELCESKCLPIKNFELTQEYLKIKSWIE